LARDSLAVKIEEGSGTSREIPVRYLVFSGASSQHWARGEKFSVLYLFNANGVYVNQREDARVVLNKNIFGKYSYFCKVEWKFFNIKLGKVTYPNRDEAIEASQRLLSVILPVLEADHLPVYDK
jgi:hypothetical protein